MIHRWKNIFSNFKSMSKLECSGCYNEEFYKLAKMSLPEIRKYVYTNYPKSKANFFIKYKLPQYTIFLSSSHIQNSF